MSDLTPETLAELKRLEQDVKVYSDDRICERKLVKALRNAAPALIAAAEECERLRGLLGNLESCPFCRYWKHRGHATDCPTSRRD